MDTTQFKAPNTLPPPHPLETEVRQAEAALAQATAEAQAAAAGNADAQTRLASARARVSSAKTAFDEEAGRRAEARERADKEKLHGALVARAAEVNAGISQALAFIRESLEAHARIAADAAMIDPSIFSHYKAVPPPPESLKSEEGEAGPHPRMPFHRTFAFTVEYADARDNKRWRTTLPIGPY